MSTYDRDGLNGGLPVVVVDLDSTLCDTTHRRALAPTGADMEDMAKWDAYSRACGGDGLIEGVNYVVTELYVRNSIFLLSARNDSAEAATRNWLTQHGVVYDRLRLRAADEGEGLTPAEWKVSVLQEWRAAGYDLQLFIDDWAGTCQLVNARLGIPTLTPAPAGNYQPGH